MSDNGANLNGLAPPPAPNNSLYRNLGNGRFADYTDSTASGDSGYGMGVAAADYDNDGDYDLFLVNFRGSIRETGMAQPSLYTQPPNTLVVMAHR